MATMQYSTTARSDAMDAIDLAIGNTAILKIWTGALPANCAAADSGTAIVSMTLPTDVFTQSGGVLTKAGTWSGTAGSDNTAGHFRIYESTGTTCHVQGDITTVAVGTGAMLLDTTSIVNGQTVTVTSFTITAGGA